jgi:MEMO1 family protein
MKHDHREVTIVPILVPCMSWERLVELADRTTRALSAAMKKRGLALGRDVAVLISSDSVHYGDRDWGGRSFAELGTNGAGYDKAVARDQGLIRDHLSGVLSCARIEGFYRKVVAEDYHDYRITWCGRFSIPFGLTLLHGLGRALEAGPVRGDALRYATTLDPGRTDPGVEGLGITAGASLRHWVGFCAVGYRLAGAGEAGPHRD